MSRPHGENAINHQSDREPIALNNVKALPT